MINISTYIYQESQKIYNKHNLDRRTIVNLLNGEEERQFILQSCLDNLSDREKKIIILDCFYYDDEKVGCPSYVFFDQRSSETSKTIDIMFGKMFNLSMVIDIMNQHKCFTRSRCKRKITNEIIKYIDGKESIAIIRLKNNLGELGYSRYIKRLFLVNRYSRSYKSNPDYVSMDFIAYMLVELSLILTKYNLL